MAFSLSGLKTIGKSVLAACVLLTLCAFLYISLSTTRFNIIAPRNLTAFLPSTQQPARKSCLDIHIDEVGHVYSECSPHHSNSWGDPKKQIAIGGGITSTGMSRLDRSTLAKEFPLFSVFIPSFCRTCSSGYHYHFYLGHDAVDGYFSNAGSQREFTEVFYEKINEFCSKDVDVTLHFVLCNHHKKPAWAQNDAMMEAYIDNMEYFYRVNDDTEMLAGGWTEAFIKVLGDYKPANVGVVGPNHSGGNIGILTYDFTHKTHIEIFGFHYPRELTDWWADDWVTYVYQPGRSTKLNHIPLRHTLQMGQRYSTDYNKGNIIASVIEKNKRVLNRYVQFKESTGTPIIDGKRVISMSLYGKEPIYTYGAIRNAQIAKIFFPGWSLRFYIPSQNGTKPEWLVPERVVYRLEQLGAEIVYVTSSDSHIPPSLYNLLIADNESVEYFVVRSPINRLSDRDFSAVSDWLMSSGVRPVHCLRDHEIHADKPIISGLWGARRAELMRLLGKPMLVALQEAATKTPDLSPQQFVNNTLWPIMKDSALAHDSVSCDKWPHSVAFTVAREAGEYIGQVVDPYGVPLDTFKGPSATQSNCSGI